MINATIPLDNILTMLQPLSQDSKKWLADRLYEEIQSSGNLARMKKRLSELSVLKQGWDGNNALPVNMPTVNNMEAVLQNCQDKDLENWVLFPDVDGSLYLDLKSDNIDAGIILSDTSFSYFANEEGEKNIPFTPVIFTEVIRNINKLS